MSIVKDDWIGFFPFEAPRVEQEDAINFILNAYIHDGKRFVIADLGTGIGKSAIAVTVARYMDANTPDVSGVERGAWFLTTQKILQEQYCNDFGSNRGPMRDVKSATNYKCSHFKKVNCSEGMQMLKAADKSSKFWKSCMFNCVYKKTRKEFLESRESVTNFSYALTASNYGDKIGRRNLLVIDECHNADAALSLFIEIIITDKTTHAIGVEWPTVTTYAQAVKWIKEDYLINGQRVAFEMAQDVEQFKGLEGHEKEYADLSKKHEALQTHIDKIKTFLQVNTPDNWVFEQLPPVGRVGGKITFKPIDVSPFAEQTLFKLGSHVLLMSATVINPKIYAESLGISPDQYVSITKESPFPVENRPIFAFPIGNMSADHIDETLPKMVEALREILKEHKSVKGIVHCHSFKVSNYIRKNLRSSRLIFHDSHDREDALRKHLESKEPTVLFSPSMSEGVDLRDDLARFQILLKVPYPSLGDKLVRKRMHRWTWWYPMQTIKTIVQSVGRGVRSETDHAVTYILDADWGRFYDRHKDLFPNAFKLALSRR